ncbi:hypothetical protein [Delftia phage PhiW-14]|uniref:Uncharacterized protein n=1 Tax=Delftia phage PhiW-14 TaxID=665032 RepID=C9DGC7_BPW14|nr:hypothetical protein DP-phiW-14_gp157 [Delftia phage PhiW-14]ACV50178.1 hypothetical protein [Delftia phage PhiW-14]
MSGFIRQAGPSGQIAIGSLEWHQAWKWFIEATKAAGYTVVDAGIDATHSVLVKDVERQAHLFNGQTIIPRSLTRSDDQMWFNFSLGCGEHAEPRYNPLVDVSGEIMFKSPNWDTIWGDFIWFTDCGMKLGGRIENIPAGAEVRRRLVTQGDDLFTAINDHHHYNAVIRPYSIMRSELAAGKMQLILTYVIESEIPDRSLDVGVKLHHYNHLYQDTRPKKAGDYICLISGTGRIHWRLLAWDGHDWKGGQGGDIYPASWVMAYGQTDIVADEAWRKFNEMRKRDSLVAEQQQLTKQIDAARLSLENLIKKQAELNLRIDDVDG